MVRPIVRPVTFPSHSWYAMPTRGTASSRETFALNAAEVLHRTACAPNLTVRDVTVQTEIWYISCMIFHHMSAMTAMVNSVGCKTHPHSLHKRQQAPTPVTERPHLSSRSRCGSKERPQSKRPRIQVLERPAGRSPVAFRGERGEREWNGFKTFECLLQVNWDHSLWPRRFQTGPPSTLHDPSYDSTTKFLWSQLKAAER